jgi:PHP family Zn ribbon phosphoesterase
MTPANIIGMASLIGLDLVALTDHNSCKNCEAFLAAAKQFGILAIPGMELCTSEEVHVLCYFPCLEDAMAFDAFVESHLPPGENRADIFGNQYIYNKDDELAGELSCLLIERSSLSFFELYDIVPRFHGIFGPAHLDRTSNSLISNLGFVPPNSTFPFAEIKDARYTDQYKAWNPYLNKCRIIYDSDAHYLDRINEPINKLPVNSKNIESVLETLADPGIVYQ